jgi:hypothetical protein
VFEASAEASEKGKRREFFMAQYRMCINMLQREKSSRRDGHKGVSFLA